MSRIWKHFSTAFHHYHHHHQLAVVHVSSLATRSLLARSLASSFGFFLLPLFALSPNKRASYLTSCGKRKRRFTLVKSVGIARNSSEEKKTQEGGERGKRNERSWSLDKVFFSLIPLFLFFLVYFYGQGTFLHPHLDIDRLVSIQAAVSSRVVGLLKFFGWKVERRPLNWLIRERLGTYDPLSLCVCVRGNKKKTCFPANL